MNILIETVLLSLSALIWVIIIPLSTARKDTTKLSGILTIFALVIHTGWIVYRSVIAGHAPFSGAYESMAFFGWLYLLKMNLLSRYEQRTHAFINIPAVLLIIGALILPVSYKEATALLPALRSPWFIVHVPLFFWGYVSLTVAFVMSLIAKKHDIPARKLESEAKQAFFFITAGIITGAFWGEAAWGNFWNWDPKEIWALITWLILINFFHFKNDRIRRGVLIIAFIAMLFTYFGVMFLLPGLHSYV